MSVTVHKEDADTVQFYEDGAPLNQKCWRVSLKDGVLQIVLFDDAVNEYRGLQIERRGTQAEVFRNRDVRL